MKTNFVQPIDKCIGVSVYKRVEVWNWAQKQNITLEYSGTSMEPVPDMYVDYWHVPNEQDKIMFILRWS